MESPVVHRFFRQPKFLSSRGSGAGSCGVLSLTQTPIGESVLGLGDHRVLPNRLFAGFLVAGKNDFAWSLEQISLAVVQALRILLLDLELGKLIDIVELIQNELEVGRILAINSACPHAHSLLSGCMDT